MPRLSKDENVGTACLTVFQCCLPQMIIPLKVTVSVWTFFCFTGSSCLNLICYMDWSGGEGYILMAGSYQKELKHVVNLRVPNEALLHSLFGCPSLDKMHF